MGVSPERRPREGGMRNSDSEKDAGLVCAAEVRRAVGEAGRRGTRFIAVDPGTGKVFALGDPADPATPKCGALAR